MGNDFFEGIMQGLDEALAITRGEINPASVNRMAFTGIKDYSPSEIKSIRLRANMTQTVFADCLGVSQKSIEAWEGGRSKPNGSARRLLGLMEDDPLFMTRVGVYRHEKRYQSS